MFMQIIKIVTHSFESSLVWM